MYSRPNADSTNWRFEGRRRLLYDIHVTSVVIVASSADEEVALHLADAAEAIVGTSNVSLTIVDFDVMNSPSARRVRPRDEHSLAIVVNLRAGLGRLKALRDEVASARVVTSYPDSIEDVIDPSDWYDRLL